MKLELFNYLFILIIGFVSFSVIKRDIKKKKIRNVDIIRGFILGVAAYLIADVTSNIELSYIQNVFLNTISATLVAYIFWLFNLWPAGDAKFFMMLSFLIPLSYYSNSYFPIFPSFILLVNIFCITFLFLLLCSTHYLCRNVLRRKFSTIYLSRLLEFKKNSRVTDNIKLFFKKILINFSIVLVFSIFAKNLGNKNEGGSYDFFLRYLVGFFISMIVVYILNVYLEDTQDYKISREELKEGMVLSSKNLNKGILEKDFLEKIGALRADGLSTYQVGEMCNIFRAKGIDEIWVQKHIPFSPWILFGVLVTILLKGSLLEIIFKLL